MTSEKTPLKGGAVGCPVSPSLDPAAVPLPVALLLPAALLLWGASVLARLGSVMSDGEEQTAHGVVMMLFAYPLGLAIPHARIKLAMKAAHGVR